MYFHQEVKQMNCLYDLWVIGGHYFGTDSYMQFLPRSREELGVSASEEDLVKHSKIFFYEFISSFRKRS